jgi:hypothetical protein
VIPKSTAFILLHLFQYNTPLGAKSSNIAVVIIISREDDKAVRSHREARTEIFLQFSVWEQSAK